nr:hypothetical protein [Tanacetum cinerariifolium]
MMWLVVVGGDGDVEVESDGCGDDDDDDGVRLSWSTIEVVLAGDDDDGRDGGGMVRRLIEMVVTRWRRWCSDGLDGGSDGVILVEVVSAVGMAGDGQSGAGKLLRKKE